MLKNYIEYISYMKLLKKTIVLIVLIVNSTIYAQKSSPEAVYDSLFKKSQDAYYKSDFKTYKYYTDKTILFTKKHKLKQQHLLSLMNKGIYHKNVGELDSTLITYLSIYEKVKTYPDTSKTKILVQFNLANAYSNMNMLDKTKSLLKQVIANASQHTDADRVLIGANTSLGNIYLKTEDYDKAKSYFLKAKQLAVKNDKAQLISIINNQLFITYYQQKQYEKALQTVEDAIQLNPLDSNTTKVSSLFKKAKVLNVQNQIEETLDYLNKAQSIASVKKYHKLSMEISEVQAKVYEKTKDYEQSLQAQKLYLKKKEKYLSTLSKAKRIEIEKELKQQEAINKNYFFRTAFIIILLVIGFFFFYVWSKKRKHKLVIKQNILQRDKNLLYSENEVLKNKVDYLVTEISNKSSKGPVIKYKKSSLSEEDKKKYIEQILKFMDTEKPYLDYNMKQSDITEKLNISLHHFSEILNTSLQKNFNNFINSYRVEEAKRMIKNPSYNDYKLISIGYEAGFKSKTSFNRAFKNMVGVTPSEYKSNV